MVRGRSEGNPRRSLPGGDSADRQLATPEIKLRNVARGLALFSGHGRAVPDSLLAPPSRIDPSPNRRHNAQRRRELASAGAGAGRNSRRFFPSRTDARPNPGDLTCCRGSFLRPRPRRSLPGPPAAAPLRSAGQGDTATAIPSPPGSQPPTGSRSSGWNRPARTFRRPSSRTCNGGAKSPNPAVPIPASRDRSNRQTSPLQIEGAMALGVRHPQALRPSLGTSTGPPKIGFHSLPARVGGPTLTTLR